MFRTAPAAEPAPDVKFSADVLIAISVLALDLAEPPVGGWAAYLKGRGIAVIDDGIGRPSISRDDARQLLDEKRENEARRREIAERQERQAIE